MTLFQCFECPNRLSVALSETTSGVSGMALCSECCHERGITPEIAEIIMKIDRRFGNPCCVWEAWPREPFKMLWAAAVEGVDGQDIHNKYVDIEGHLTEAGAWIVAKNLIYAMNVLWHGPEVLII